MPPRIPVEANEEHRTRLAGAVPLQRTRAAEPPEAATAPVPFNRPYVVGTELRYVAQAMAAGHISGDGAFTARCSEELRRRTGSPATLLTTSCTHALEMAGLLLDLQSGDEVIMPSYTFVSTANAFALRGAVPVFVDIRPDTLNIDELAIAAAITERTRAIVVVHYAGVACEMDSILDVARRAGIPVVEDNAHGLGGTYRGRPLGSLGALGTLSFHETKNVQCGEGGALLVNDEELLPRAEVLREKGTNRSRFFRGEVDKYTWVDHGSSYLPSDMLAGYLLGQLEAFDQIQDRRTDLWRTYARELAGWAQSNDVGLPQVPAHVEHPAHLFYVLLPDLARRTAFLAHLRRAGVHAVFHYVPLHSSPQGRAVGRTAGPCGVTADVSDRLARLPLHTGLTADEQQRVLEATLSFSS